MKELDFLKIINETLDKKEHLGDDCAYLKELGIVVTHDTLVENVHFSLKYSKTSDIAFKSIAVNLSDIYASGAIPKYVTISLSLPKNIKDEFVEVFYETVNKMSNEYDFEVIGGDITGSEKIIISVCAIGITQNRNISSRSNAKVGDIVVTTGDYGTSSAGLWALQNNVIEEEITNLHLKPVPQKDFSEQISQKVKRYAMMDSSDGLVDAAFKIAQSSKVKIIIDKDKIPYNVKIRKIAKKAKINYQDWILYGGEDFQLVATLSKKDLEHIKCKYYVIGQVESAAEGCAPLEIISNSGNVKIKDLEKSYNHFEEKKE